MSNVSGNLNMTLLLSASVESEWAKALRVGLTKYGDTPIYDALAIQFDRKESTA